LNLAAFRHNEPNRGKAFRGLIELRGTIVSITRPS
jgi:hypothetical protein